MSAPQRPEQPALVAAAKAALKTLEPRQRKFVEAFCRLLNATKAAQAAGYSQKTARQMGSENLSKPDIKKAIVAVFATSAMEPQEIAARWTAIARAGLDDFFTKVRREAPTMRPAPLGELIAEIRERDARDYEYTERSVPILGLDGDKLAEHWEMYNRRRCDRELQVLKHQMELERDPAATYEVPGGEPIVTYHMELDLVKAADLGLLDLVKMVTPTEFGLKVELRSPDAALDNLAKWQGMLTTKVDLTSGGQPIAPPPIVSELSAATIEEILAARQKQRQEGAEQ